MAADGDFRLAGAFVEVNLKDNTEADEARIRRRLEAGGPVDFETALKDPTNIRRVKERVESGAPIKLVTEADITQAKATIAELEASKKSTTINVDANIKAAQVHLAELQARPIKVDADIAAAKARIQALLDSRASKTLKIDADIDTAKAKIETLLGQRSTAVTPDFFNGLTKQIRDAELQLERFENEKRDLTVDVVAQTQAAVAEIARLKALRPTVEAEIEPKVEKVTTTLAALEARKVRIEADVDADLARVRAQLEALSAEHVEVEVDVELDKPAAKKLEDDVESAVDRVANRANAKMEGIKFAVLFAGLPAAAAVGAAGVGVALSAVPLLFAGMAIAALGANSDIADSTSSLARHISTEMTSIAQPMAGTFVEATGMIGTSFDRLEPQISKAMLGSQKPFLTFVSGVTDFAENAMPGFNAAIDSSQGPMEGMKSLLAQTGSGLTDMFVNLATGSAGAKTGLEDFGGIVRDAEGFLGQFLANLANGSHGVLPQFGGAMNQVYGILNTLTSSGMPALTGVTSGFLGTVGGGLGIVQGFSSALGSWAQPLGSLGGSLFATNTIAKVFGTSIGQTGLGIGAFATTTDAAGNKTNAFKTAIGGATGPMDKLKAGAGSLVSAGINPMGLALGIGSIALAEIGRRQQEAAEKASAHREAVRELTAAYREDAGVMGDSVKATLSKSLSDKNAEGNARALGVSMDIVNAATQGGASAMVALEGRTDKLIDGFVKSGAVTEAQGATLSRTSDKLRELGGASSDFAHDWGNLNQAQKDSVIANENLQGAVGSAVRQAREAHDVYVAGQVALSGWGKAQVEASMSSQKHTASLYEQQNAMLGLRGAEVNTAAALVDYNKIKDDSKATDLEKAAALLKVEQSFAAQENAAYQNAYALNANKSEVERLAAAGQAADAKLVQLANTFSGPLPASMQQTISGFTVAQARAAGLTVGIDETGNAVYRLPNGKTIEINANTNPADVKIATLQGKLNAIDGRIITSYVDVVTRYKSVGTAGVRTGVNAPDFYVNGPHAWAGGLLGYAAGGPTEKATRFPAGAAFLDVLAGGLVSGPGTETSDSVPAWTSTGPAALSDAEFVNNARSTKVNLEALQYANAGGRIMPVPEGGLVASYARLQAPQATPAPVVTPAAVAPMGGGVTINITINPPAGMDVYALASQVSREIELRSKTGA